MSVETDAPPPAGRGWGEEGKGRREDGREGGRKGYA